MTMQDTATVAAPRLFMADPAKVLTVQTVDGQTFNLVGGSWQVDSEHGWTGHIEGLVNEMLERSQVMIAGRHIVAIKQVIED